MGIGGASSLVYGLKMNSSPLAKLLLQAESGGGQQVWDNYNHNHNYNYNNHNDNWNYNYGYDHNAAQSRLQLQGWEFSQPTNHNYTTPCAPFYNTNPKNEDDDVVVAQLPNLAFPNLSSATSSSSSSSSSSSASAFSLLYGNHHRAGSCLLDSILGPLVKRSRSDFTSPTTTTFAPVTPASIATAHSPSCQALGCKADLRLSKHYHRRHKVCEQHSKAASIVINGNPQRFCQQCSRFHSLSEFDDGKRSCRKRLADHNRRRRKPQPINSNANTTNGVVAASNSTSNDSSTNTTSSNTTTTTSTTNTATAMDTTMTMSITFPNNTTSSKSNHKNEHLDQENKEKKGQLEDKIMHMHSSSGSNSSSSSIGSILSLSGGQVDLPSITWKLHSPNVHSNNNNNNNSNGTFATTIQNHQKHHVEEKHHHHYIVEEEEEDKKDFFSEDYPFFSKSNSNGGKIEGLQSLRIPFHKLIYNDSDHYL